jgi:hypothetical protein
MSSRVNLVTLDMSPIALLSVIYCKCCVHLAPSPGILSAPFMASSYTIVFIEPISLVLNDTLFIKKVIWTFVISSLFHDIWREPYFALLCHLPPLGLSCQSTLSLWSLPSLKFLAYSTDVILYSNIWHEPYRALTAHLSPSLECCITN